MEQIIRALHSSMSVMLTAVTGIASGQTDIIEGSTLLNRERMKYIATFKALRAEDDIRRFAANALFSKTV